MSLTWAGVSPGAACLIRAQIPATCGAAAEVPLNAAQPSLFAVSSPSGCVLPAYPTSIEAPSESGSVM